MSNASDAPLGGPTGGAALPLEGIRVIELGYGIAAPVAARNLAQFGADVIRVESVRKPDSLRVSGAGWVPRDFDPAVRLDTMPALNFSCAGKRSVALEIDDDEGYAVLVRLVAGADVFVTNMSADVLPRLRLTYDDLRAHRPDLVYMSMPPFGDERSPYRTYRTWGQNLSAISGIDRMIGWPDRDPVQLGFAYPDYVSAQAGTMAVVAALDRRDDTGAGCNIELSQYEMALAAIAPNILGGQLHPDAAGAESNGNRADGVAPQGVYPCRGRDRWVAVTVADDTAWAGLVTVAGLTHLDEARFATLEARQSAHDHLDAELSAWSSGRTDWEAAEELQHAGVMASPVFDAWDLLGDHHLAAREAFRVLPHPRFGADLVFGQAAVMSETQPRFATAAPSIGEHTRPVLRDVGLGDDEIDALVGRGIVHEMGSPDVTLERPYAHWIHTLMRLPWPPASFDPAELFMARLAAPAERAGGGAGA